MQKNLFSQWLPGRDRTKMYDGDMAMIQKPEERLEQPDGGPLWAPLMKKNADGLMVDGCGLDRVFWSADLLIVTGWALGEGVMVLTDPAGEPILPDFIHEVVRGDVPAEYPSVGMPKGFLALWRRSVPAAATVSIRLDEQIGRSLKLGEFDPRRLEVDLLRLLNEYKAAHALIFDAVLDVPYLLADVAKAALSSTAPGTPRGHLEVMRVVPGAGGLCAGWTIGRAAAFYLIDEYGRCQPMTGQAIRWNRADIFEAFSSDYGADCADAGFVQAWKMDAEPGGLVRLIARQGQAGLFAINERMIELAPLDAVGYARWAFTYPIPIDRTVERFTQHDGPILTELIVRSRRDHSQQSPLIKHAGPPVDDPIVSIIVPLFGRFDFVDHQLLEFAADPFIAKRCEVIYVVDDPDLVSPVAGSLERWWKLYGVPVTMVWGGHNRGFSGANNLGLSIAHGRQIAFVNSDVIPTGPGWLATLSRRLDDNPDYVLLGPRLLYPGGGLQHDGMMFEFNYDYGVWLNEHPRKGYAPSPSRPGEIRAYPATTGACVVGSREDFLAVGGFSEDYLIGDFEDSDLCLKLQAGGRRVGVCQDVVLTHLERQSFGLLGGGEFRVRVTLFNAWLHQTRWGETIESQMSKQWAEPRV